MRNGGALVEGPMLMRGFESFVGQFPIPMRHGMTIGELARLFNEEFGIGAKLEVVKMEGWTRDTWYDETGLPWVSFASDAEISDEPTPSAPSSIPCLTSACMRPSSSSVGTRSA